MDYIFDLEELFKKCHGLYVYEQDLAILFLFEDWDDVTEVNLSFNNLFNEENVAIDVKYNLKYANISLISEKSHQCFVSPKLMFNVPKHFEFIKPMANMFNGVDVLGRKLNKELMIAAGLLLPNGGVSGGRFFADNQRLWKVNKFTTQLIK